MRRIIKGREPVCLAGVRADAERIEAESGRAPTGDDWDLKTCAQPSREGLCGEPLGLCAYCTDAIRPLAYDAARRAEHGMKIEHFKSRKDYPREMYEWSNLLGACGGERQWKGEIVRTCDTHRGSAVLHVHPAASPLDPATAFPADFGRAEGVAGRLSARSDAPDLLSDLEHLNLNAEVLCSNRMELINSLRLKLATDDSEAMLRRLHHESVTPASGRLPPFAPFAAQYLERKLRQPALRPNALTLLGVAQARRLGPLALPLPSD